jgi:methionyl aminopeptidase
MVVTAVADIQGAETAARCVVDTHWRLAEYLRPGLALPDIDRFVADALKEMGGRSAFFRYRISGYPPFPSHSCLSVNECVVHGTHLMRRQPLVAGDIISIDVGVIHRGWVGDAAWTYAIGHAGDDALRLMRCGRESLRVGLDAIRPGRPLLDWARAVQDYVEGTCGFHLVRGLGGHGYGRQLHGPPFVSNVLPRYGNEWPDQWKPFQPGMLLAVEPMVAMGTAQTVSEPRQWPIRTADGSLSVHYEANVIVTAEGCRNLTQGMRDLPEVVG